MLNFLRKLNTIDDYYSYILFILIKKKPFENIIW